MIELARRLIGARAFFDEMLTSARPGGLNDLDAVFMGSVFGLVAKFLRLANFMIQISRWCPYNSRNSDRNFLSCNKYAHGRFAVT